MSTKVDQIEGSTATKVKGSLSSKYLDQVSQTPNRKLADNQGSDAPPYCVDVDKALQYLPTTEMFFQKAFYVKHRGSIENAAALIQKLDGKLVRFTSIDEYIAENSKPAHVFAKEMAASGEFTKVVTVDEFKNSLKLQELQVTCDLLHKSETYKDIYGPNGEAKMIEAEIAFNELRKELRVGARTKAIMWKKKLNSSNAQVV